MQDLLLLTHLFIQSLIYINKDTYMFTLYFGLKSSIIICVCVCVYFLFSQITALAISVSSCIH